MEPNPDFIGEFRSIRGGDITVNAAVSSTPRTLTYHRFSDGQLNGFLHQDMVDYHITRGVRYLGSQEIECLGIEEFLRECVPDDKEVDLLSIDIELHELDVLSRWNFNTYRPKLICIEILCSDIQAAQNSDVAKLLCRNGYVFVSRCFQSSFFADSRVWPG